jgi:hypothetical protein
MEAIVMGDTSRGHRSSVSSCARGEPVVLPCSDPDARLEHRLERGEVVYYPQCPFSVPIGNDLAFLLEQRLGSRAHKNISFDPQRNSASGFSRESPAQAERLRCLLAAFSQAVAAWTAAVLPLYPRVWRLDRVSFRPEEEATRSLRLKARNDLLHVDAFPSRPTQGWRILRVFVNVNPTEPRIWVTSEPFGQLLQRYGEPAGLPGKHSSNWVRQLLRIFRPGQPQRSAYDEFMLRFHDYLKANEIFQERTMKRFWTFAPGSAWMAMTDTASHAVLRGRFALEHSFFVAPEALALPAESPAALLAKACGCPVLPTAA